MLDCKRNRLDYGELLRPEPGYRLDQAVATTYSADLATLLSIPVALVYAQTLEGDMAGTRFQLLEAIKQFSRQVKVYHQMGQLHVPAKLNWLHAYLEDALFAILPGDAYTSFHPKVWIIRYVAIEEEDGPTQYRVIVLSRNLTFDRSWDVAAALNGIPGKAEVRTNQPLLDFVNWLHEKSPIPGVETFRGELSRVRFETPLPFDSHAFHPMGIGKRQANPVAIHRSEKSLVLSPFLHEGALQALIENSATAPEVFSERRELEKLPLALLRQFRSYHLSDLIVDGERMENAEEGSGDVQQQHLHAKTFVFESRESTSWFLGSANATKAAFERNVEFMLEARGSSPAIKVRPRLKELTGEAGGEGPFVEFDGESGGKDDSEERHREQEIRRFEHALLGSMMRGDVKPTECGVNFDLHLTLGLEDVPDCPHLRLMVQPFNNRQRFTPHRLETGESNECSFWNLAEVELSRFLHFRIERIDGSLEHEFLHRIELSGLPADRLDNILRKIVDSSDKFFDYLRFLLADEITKEDLLVPASEDQMNEASPVDGLGGWGFQLPLYEQLLVTASRSPRRLAEVDEVIRHLSSGTGESVVPESFRSFWDAFRHLIPNIPKKST